jgi:hypothetical protein
MVNSPTQSSRGVPLESSGLRFSSGRSMEIRLFLKIYRLAPAFFVSLSGEYPMLLFHGPLNSFYNKASLYVQLVAANLKIKWEENLPVIGY